MGAAEKPRKFEDELKDLEELVARIDSGDLTLEDSIAAFERGVALVRSLNQKLEEIERKVEVLTRNAQGELKTRPFEATDAAAHQSKTAKSSSDDDEDPPF
jgi:exodeoxyribonuclease VII small subunit